MSELTPIKVSLFPKTNLLAAESFYVLFADSEKGFGVSSKIAQLERSCDCVTYRTSDPANSRP